MTTYKTEDFIRNVDFIGFVANQYCGGFFQSLYNEDELEAGEHYADARDAIRDGYDLAQMVEAYDAHCAELREESEWFDEYSEWVEKNPGEAG